MFYRKQAITVVSSHLCAARHSHVSQENTVIGCNNAGSWIFGNKHDTAKMFCNIFTAAKTFLDVVTCKIKHFITFLQGVSKALLCKPCIRNERDVRPSDRLSVTRWHCVKTTQTRTTKSSPRRLSKDSSFRDKKIHPGIRKGSPQAMALNDSGVGKIRNFQPITRRISETVHDRTTGPKLLLMTNRKSHMPFRLVPKSTTLDDLERPIRILFHKRCQRCVCRSPPQKIQWR